MGDNKKVVIPRLEEIFPLGMIGGIESWGDIRHIGKNNIQGLVSFLRAEEKRLTEKIRVLCGKKKVIAGKKSADFIEMAEGYESPLFPRILQGMLFQEYYSYPLDADSINRKPEATTLSVCGWCKYVKGDIKKFFCACTGTCTLLEEEVVFSAKCLLQDITEEERDNIIERYEAEFTSLKEKREEIRKCIKKFQDLQGTVNKPYLIDLRPDDYFNLGDEVVVYINNIWVSARVVRGDGHHEGRVSFLADRKIHEGSELDGYGTIITTKDPAILLKKDFLDLQTAFEEEIKFFGIWLNNALGGEENQKFKEAVILGEIAE